ncbi:MAG TPA: KH domain-containing protein [Thermomicrobiales bacterium]|nr:KH domain-containing protein [Thermomicrobiales bacterium]
MDDQERYQAEVHDEPIGDDQAFADDDDVVAEGGTPAERLSGLVAYLAGNLIDDPAAVDVEVQQRGSSIHLTLRVPDDELGKVIGRQGRIARALRTALSIAGARSDVRATLDIEG